MTVSLTLALVDLLLCASAPLYPPCAPHSLPAEALPTPTSAAAWGHGGSEHALGAWSELQLELSAEEVQALAHAKAWEAQQAALGTPSREAARDSEEDELDRTPSRSLARLPSLSRSSTMGRLLQALGGGTVTGSGTGTAADKGEDEAPGGGTREASGAETGADAAEDEATGGQAHGQTTKQQSTVRSMLLEALGPERTLIRALIQDLRHAMAEGSPKGPIPRGQQEQHHLMGEAQEEGIQGLLRLSAGSRMPGGAAESNHRQAHSGTAEGNHRQAHSGPLSLGHSTGPPMQLPRASPKTSPTLSSVAPPLLTAGQAVETPILRLAQGLGLGEEEGSPRVSGVPGFCTAWAPQGSAASASQPTSSSAGSSSLDCAKDKDSFPWDSSGSASGPGDPFRPHLGPSLAAGIPMASPGRDAPVPSRRPQEQQGQREFWSKEEEWQAGPRARLRQVLKMLGSASYCSRLLLAHGLPEDLLAALARRWRWAEIKGMSTMLRHAAAVVSNHQALVRLLFSYTLAPLVHSKGSHSCLL